MVFARVALGSGPGNPEHFSLALAYLAQSEDGQVKGFAPQVYFARFHQGRRREPLEEFQNLLNMSAGFIRAVRLPMK